ncbi:MAG TPA: hypothetical protein VNL69_05635 [Bacteroidota bacterium]|nr:hypothetical protein [Bacteroidota bacterium]
MKNTHTPFAMLAVLVAAAFLLFGCEGPQGPAGKDGKDGQTGVLNLEGFAPGINCGSCHNPDIDTTYYLWARRYQWERSLHAYGGDLERNGPNCAGCHTTEGLIERWKNNWSTQVVGAKDNPSPPGCFACHSPHSRGNFTLRDTTPVTIASFIVGVPDATFDYGKGNMCVQCHQTRTASPMTPKPDPTKTAPTDTIVITSSRWYPHYGVQGQMLMGTGGFEFQGYNYRGHSNHTTNATIRQEGCVICHMASQVYPPDLGTGRGGGHTMKIRYSSTEAGTDTLFVLTGCNQSGCHGAGGFTKTSLLAAEKAIEDSLHALETLLIQRGWLTTSGLVNASSSRPLKIAPAAKAGALYNYFFVEHDASRGMHNTKYAQDLLNSSLQALRTP